MSQSRMSVWETGSYEVVGDWFADASRSVLDTADGPLALDGARLLDVACGTGAVAIEAARRGAGVTAVDVTPHMLEVADGRARSAGVELELIHGSFEDLGGLGTFDVVTSAFGVMFAGDPPSVAGQLAGACREQGTIALAAWHPDGAFGAPSAELAELLPPPAVRATDWADAQQLEEFFGQTEFAVLDSLRREMPIPFASLEEAVEQVREHSGPWMALFAQMEAQGTAELGRRRLVEHWKNRSEPVPDGVALRADYVVSHLGH